MILMLTVNQFIYSQIKRKEIRHLDFDDNAYWQKIITGKAFKSVQITHASLSNHCIDFKFTGYKRWHTTEFSKNKKMRTYLRVFLSEEVV